MNPSHDSPNRSPGSNKEASVSNSAARQAPGLALTAFRPLELLLQELSQECATKILAAAAPQFSARFLTALLEDLKTENCGGLTELVDQFASCEEGSISFLTHVQKQADEIVSTPAYRISGDSHEDFLVATIRYDAAENLYSIKLSWDDENCEFYGLGPSSRWSAIEECLTTISDSFDFGPLYELSYGRKPHTTHELIADQAWIRLGEIN